MLICGIFVHKARVVSAPKIFVLQLFAKTAFFSFVSSRRLLLLCYILESPYWGWNNTDKMIHTYYYIYVGLLRGS